MRRPAAIAAPVAAAIIAAIPVVAVVPAAAAMSPSAIAPWAASVMAPAVALAVVSVAPAVSVAIVSQGGGDERGGAVGPCEAAAPAQEARQNERRGLPQASRLERKSEACQELPGGWRRPLLCCFAFRHESFGGSEPELSARYRDSWLYKLN